MIGGPIPTTGRMCVAVAEVYGVKATDGLHICTSVAVTLVAPGLAGIVANVAGSANPFTELSNAQDAAFAVSTAVWTVAGAQALLTITNNGGGYDGPCPPWNDERIHQIHERSLELYGRMGEVFAQNADIIRRLDRVERIVNRHREKLRSVDDTGSHELAEHRDWSKWWKRTLVKVAIGVATVLISAGAAALVSRAVVQSSGGK